MSSHPDKLTLDIATRLVRYRKRRKLERTELAELSGLSLSYVKKLERGESSPTVRTLNAYLQVCEISLGEFFEPYVPANDKKLRDRHTQREIQRALDDSRRPYVLQFLEMLATQQ